MAMAAKKINETWKYFSDIRYTITAMRHTYTLYEIRIFTAGNDEVAKKTEEGGQATGFRHPTSDVTDNNQSSIISSNPPPLQHL